MVDRRLMRTRRWDLVGAGAISIFLLVMVTNDVQASTHNSVSQTRLSSVPGMVTNTPTSTQVPVYCGLFINFTAAVNYPLGTRPRSVTVGDLNNDGGPDLVFVEPGSSSNVAVLLGNRNGTFQQAINSPAGSSPYIAEVKDFNQDGNLDVAVPRSTTGTIQVLLGNGNGTFGTGVDYSVGGIPYAAVAADFNGDGLQDLAVTTSDAYVAVLLGNGDGTFQQSVNYAVSWNAYLLDVGDLNGDGHPDLVLPGYNSGNVAVLLGNGNGTFQQAINSPTGPHPFSLVVRDFNGDDHQDVALTIANPNTISVLLGNGDGTLQAGINYSIGNWGSWIEAADFNGDDGQDLAVATISGVSVLLGNGDGAFQPARNFPVANNPQSVVVGDFDGDGSQDIAVTKVSSTVSVLLNTCSLPTATPTGTATRTRTTTYTPTVTGTPPTLTYTPTNTWTETPTPIPTGIHCHTQVEGATTNCISPSMYNDTFTFHTYCLQWYYNTRGYYTVYFQVATSSSGPWTTIDHQDFGPPGYIYFPVGFSDHSHTFIENDIPSQYTWYRMVLDGYALTYGGDWSQLHGVTPATLLCAPALTPTIVVTPPTSTPTHSTTPMYTPTLTNTPPTCEPGTNYLIAQSTDIITPDILDIGNHTDDGMTTITLPFAYSLYGISFTTANVSSNGNIQFSSNDAGFGDACLTVDGYNNVIFALWDDLRTDEGRDGCAAYPGGCGIFTSIEGSAPDRIFNIEWRTVYYDNDANIAHFEVRLFENQDRFEVRYAAVENGGGSHGIDKGATVGVQSGIGPQLTQFTCNTGGLTPGLSLTFQQPTCSTPIPTNTPTPSAILMGHLTWQGIAQPNAHNEGITGTLILCAAGVPNNYTTSTDANGFFTVTTGLLDGTYNWWFKGSRWLATSGTLTLSGATNQEFGIQRAGDANNSNNVEALDFTLLKNSFGRAPGEPGYAPQADFNNDTLCNINDFTLLKVSFGQVGAASNCP